LAQPCLAVFGHHHFIAGVNRSLVLFALKRASVHPKAGSFAMIVIANLQVGLVAALHV
jgi:hypothetical protein